MFKIRIQLDSKTLTNLNFFMQNIRIHPKQTIENSFGIDFVFENVIFVYQFWPKIQFLTTLTV